jgi:hypothetical protein
MILLRRSATAVAACLLACLASYAPSAHASTGVVTYHGTWSEATAPSCAQAPASGRWSVTVRPDGTAIVGVTMFLDGALHAAWGGVVFRWTSTGSGLVLTASGMSLTIEGDDVRLDVPNRYPGCDGYALGAVS